MVINESAVAYRSNLRVCFFCVNGSEVENVQGGPKSNPDQIIKLDTIKNHN